MIRCLVIEDDTSARRALASVLAAAGLTVSGADHLLFEKDDRILEKSDLVLLDLSPPYAERLDLLGRALGPSPQRPVIVCSSQTDLGSALDLIRHGAWDFVPKPLSEADLNRCVDRTLRQVLRRQEAARMSEVARQRVEDLSMLNRISGLIISAESTEHWMDSTIRATCDYLQAEAGALFLLDEPAGELVLFGAQAKSADRPVLRPQDGGIAWACLEGGRPLKVNDLVVGSRQTALLSRLMGCAVRRLLTVPVVVQERTIGVFLLANRTDGAGFDDRDMERLAELARHLAVAVHNAVSVLELKRSRDELHRMSLELGQVVEARTRALRQLREANRKVRRDMDRTAQEAAGIRRALAENDRMAVLGLLAAGVSHEINNPLSFVSNNFGVLRDYVRSMYRLAAVVSHTAKCMDAKKDDVVVRLAKEAVKVLKDENIPAVMNDVGPLFDETQQGLSRIEAIVNKLHRLAEGGLGSGEPIQIDLVAELERLAELVQGSGASPLTIRFEDGGRPVVRVPQMSLRLLLLNLLGHFTRRRTDVNRVVIRTGLVGPLVRLELAVLDASLSAAELGSLLSLEPAGKGEADMGRYGLGVAAELASEVGGQLTGQAHHDKGYSLCLLLPDAGVRASAATMGG